ncbi:unnamed protein product [Parnassius mnemosyne]|uniref:Reverse transcriptase domain-containing protein n=1 Tax=Parnassius mnemosyne TaxID=213953 RepID=A0AAV1K9G0_9NEOP
METRSKSKRIGPLPGGDRRGAPGADAGCLSMRTVSGEELNRRAPTDKDATAEIIDDGDRLTDRTDTPVEQYRPSTVSYTPSRPSIPSSPILSSPPIISLNTVPPTSTLNAARGVSTFLPASTKAGKARVRMKWSKEVNLFIMRTYLYITKLETDMTAYRQQLHALFTRQYPEITVSEQRISDQRRTIVRNKLLSQEEIHQLKEEVRIQLLEEEVVNNYGDTNNTKQSTNENSHHVQPQSLNQSQLIYAQPQPYNHSQAYIQRSHSSTQTESIILTLENDIETIVVPDQHLTTDTYIQEINEKFRTTITQYSGMDPGVRPRLPKLKYTPKLFRLINLFNETILTRYISDDTQLIDIHLLIYCTAVVISEEMNFQITDHIRTPRTRQNIEPAWQQRLEKDIEKIRANIGRLTQYINGCRSNKLVKKVEVIFRNNSTHTRHEKSNTRPEEFLDTLKQKLALKVHRLKRYKKALQRKRDNTTFATNEKMFYRNLQKPQTDTIDENTRNTSNLPTKEELEAYWASIWEEQKQHNDKASWIVEEEAKWRDIDEMEFAEVTETDITHITARLHNWKSPGIDNIHNFWYKKLTSLHKSIAKNLTDIIVGQQNVPEFIATGITYMLPKTKNSPQPSQYRPITCLPTIYKILTSAITKKIHSHIEHHNIIAEEQKGCRQGHMGCKEQLIIDSTVHKHATSKNRNLHCTYIDYKKAFDSVPHSWLLQILEIYRINPKIIDFLRRIMLQWKTKLQINCDKNTITTRYISIKKGIYQGDSLSPLWFCLALNPLSHLLQSCKAGYSLKNNTDETTISHLIYMDDIKLYAKTEKDMKKLVDITAEFSNNINMQFGLDKCKTLHTVRGKVRPGDYVVNDTDVITAMEPTDLYKYLGYVQLKGLDHVRIKSTLTTEYKRRLNAVCKKQLSGKHLIKAINTFAIPVLTYSFGVIKWSKTDTEQLERTTRTTLTKHNNLHPKSAIERLTIKRELGGRGLIDIQHLRQKQVERLKSFFYTKSHTSNIHKAIVTNDINYTPLNLSNQIETQNTTIDNQQTQKIEDWKRKVLHGRHPHDLEQPHINKLASNKWLKIGNLFPETEGFIIAIQDQIINTKNYRKYIIKDPTVINDKCRKCHIHPETIQHITGACTTLTQTDYTHRHNQVANVIHQKLALKHALIKNTNTPYYNYTPKITLENTTHKLLYDRAILTDKTIHYNRPDIILQDKINKITYLIDIAVPNTHNIQKTITEKICKYAELKDEVTRIWRQEKVYVVPIVLSTTGVIPNHLLHSLTLLDLKETLYITLQKAAILNTCRIVRKFMQIEVNEIGPHENT